MSFRVSDRVTPVIHTSYAVQPYFGLLTTPKAGFACGSMVLFYLFHKTFAQSVDVL